jgi:hypothetical protein
MKLTYGQASCPVRLFHHDFLFETRGDEKDFLKGRLASEPKAQNRSLVIVLVQLSYRNQNKNSSHFTRKI